MLNKVFRFFHCVQEKRLPTKKKKKALDGGVDWGSLKANGYLFFFAEPPKKRRHS